MSGMCRSKLCSVCWNSYVKSNLICSDYEGVVQLWDVNQQTETMTFEEHAKRVWSVDFSHVCPHSLPPQCCHSMFAAARS